MAEMTDEEALAYLDGLKNPRLGLYEEAGPLKPLMVAREALREKIERARAEKQRPFKEWVGRFGITSKDAPVLADRKALEDDVDHALANFKDTIMREAEPLLRAEKPKRPSLNELAERLISGEFFVSENRRYRCVDVEPASHAASILRALDEKVVRWIRSIAHGSDFHRAEAATEMLRALGEDVA